MKNSLTILVILITFSHTVAQDKVIYGEDDREDVIFSTESLLIKSSRAIAAMVSNIRIKYNQSHDLYQITGKTLEQQGICSDERFSEQLTSASCTGFLIAPDILITAAHCINHVSDCRLHKWVFDFRLEYQGQEHYMIEPENVYNCIEIIERKYQHSPYIDFAIIKLDRPTSNRVFLEIRQEGKVRTETPLAIIGHPTGLPLKISPNAKVRNNTGLTFFTSNLDAFAGNSGSPVIDPQTGLVEGILVRGEDDYITDSAQKCKRPKRCGENQCRGEDVIRSTIISLEKIKSLF